ncbi:MAG TPA: colicin V production protein [Flavobacteriaceae bacterium]|nr:colicin V production protein [Flavobacteriaceae bacterium]
MNTIDIILVALLLYGLVRGFMKGFFVEVTSLVALAIGLYGAIHFSYIVANYLKNSVDWTEKYIQIIAFAITFFIIVVLISFTGKILTKIADTVALGIVNKLFGAAFGFLKIGLILSVVLIIFDKLNRALPIVKEENLQSSILYAPVKNIAPMIFPTILKKEWEPVKKDHKTTI